MGVVFFWNLSLPSLAVSPAGPAAVRWVIPPEMFPEMRAFLRFVYSAQLQFPEDVFGLVDLCQRFEIPSVCLP